MSAQQKSLIKMIPFCSEENHKQMIQIVPTRKKQNDFFGLILTTFVVSVFSRHLGC